MFKVVQEARRGNPGAAIMRANYSRSKRGVLVLHRKGSLPALLAATLALVVLAGGQSYAGEPKPAAPAPQAACCNPPNTETAIEARLHQLTQPTLFAAQDSNVRALVRAMVSYQFDGDTNALFSDIIQEAESSYIVDPYAPEWIALKDAVAGFSNINGWAYQPQIYIPNQDEGIIEETDVVVAIAPADESATSTTGYRIDYYGNVYPIGTIDEYYADYHEVWVLSVNEPIPNGETPPVHAPEKAGPFVAAPSPSGPGTLAVCNPTGIRNNLGQEYLQRWRVPSRNSFGGLFEGKREMRLQILTSSGAVVRNIVFGKVKRKHIDSWQNSDLFITTWDRAVWGDVLAYVWSEIDGGPTVTIGLSIPIPGGDTITANVNWQARDDDGGNAVVMFPESTYTLYNTGSVEFNLCSMGGDGGTGNDNLACAAIASASSTYPYDGYSPAKVADCNRDTRLGGPYSWANHYNTYAPNNPQWVQVDFGVNKTFRRVVVYTSQSYPIRDFDVQVWNGVTFVTVASVTGNTSLSVTVTFTARTSRIVRVLGRHGPNHHPGYVRVNELEVYPV
jgi:hypothetical protein